MAEPEVGSDLAREALARARGLARGAGPQELAPARRGKRRPADVRDPVSAGDALADLLAERGWEEQSAVAAVVGRWPELVGAELAGHVVPESFDPGEGLLVLRADSTTWASAVRAQLGALIERVREDVGPGVVRSVRVLGPAAPSWVHGPRRVKGRGPRDTYG